MFNVFGNYVWHYISNNDKVEGVEENHQYLVCFEFQTKDGSIWKMVLAYWYEKGARITMSETDGTPHNFNVDKDGFYILDEIGGSKAPRCFCLPGVRYWTAIPEPNVNPEDILTII